MPPRHVTHLLDDPLRRQADRVPLRDAGGAAADVQADPGEAPRRGDDVVRARQAVGVGRGGARRVRAAALRSAARSAARIAEPQPKPAGRIGLARRLARRSRERDDGGTSRVSTADRRPTAAAWPAAEAGAARRPQGDRPRGPKPEWRETAADARVEASRDSTPRGPKARSGKTNRASIGPPSAEGGDPRGPQAALEGRRATKPRDRPSGSGTPPRRSTGRGPAWPKAAAKPSGADRRQDDRGDRPAAGATSRAAATGHRAKPRATDADRRARVDRTAAAATAAAAIGRPRRSRAAAKAAEDEPRGDRPRGPKPERPTRGQAAARPPRARSRRGATSRARRDRMARSPMARRRATRRRGTIGADVTGGPAASTRIRAIASRCRAT